MHGALCTVGTIRLPHVPSSHHHTHLLLGFGLGWLAPQRAESCERYPDAQVLDRVLRHVAHSAHLLRVHAVLADRCRLETVVAYCVHRNILLCLSRRSERQSCDARSASSRARSCVGCMHQQYYEGILYPEKRHFMSCACSLLGTSRMSTPFCLFLVQHY